MRRAVQRQGRNRAATFRGMPVYTLSTKNRVVGLLAALVVLGAGAALLILGLVLLAGLAVAGGVLGTGVLAYRALRGRRAVPIGGQSSAAELDPALEVFPEPRHLDRPAEPNDDPHRIAPE